MYSLTNGAVFGSRAQPWAGMLVRGAAQALRRHRSNSRGRRTRPGAPLGTPAAADYMQRHLRDHRGAFRAHGITMTPRCLHVVAVPDRQVGGLGGRPQLHQVGGPARADLRPRRMCAAVWLRLRRGGTPPASRCTCDGSSRSIALPIQHTIALPSIRATKR